MRYRSAREALPELAALLDAHKGESISMAQFNEIGVPMVVACSCCQMTMTTTSQKVRVDDELSVFCTDCVGEDCDDTEVEA